MECPCIRAGRRPGVLVSFDDEDVVVARAQRRHAGGLFGFLDAQVDARAGPLMRSGSAGIRVERQIVQESADSDRSRDLSRQGAQGLEGFGDVCVDAFPGLGDDGAGGGEDGSRGGALNELEADFFLEFLDLLGDC